MVHFDKQVPPIIERQPEGYTAHFRDPQVWRDADGSYRMLLGVQQENLTGAALLYRSTDLRAWECEGEMTFPDAGGAFDAFGYMWECPNLVRLVDEETGEAHDVLIFCPQGISPEREGFENVFPCVAIVGELVGTEFRGADGSFEELDRGTEFYAPQIMARSASSDPGAPTLLFGWAGNAGEDSQPSIEMGGWVHCFTAPRALTLRGGRVIARPYLPGLPLAPATLEGAPGDEAGARVLELAGSRSWRLAFDASYEGPLSVRIGEESGLSVTLEESRLTVDLTDTRYPHGGRRVVTLDAGEASPRRDPPRPIDHRDLPGRRLARLHDPQLPERRGGRSDARGRRLRDERERRARRLSTGGRGRGCSQWPRPRRMWSVSHDLT